MPMTSRRALLRSALAGTALCALPGLLSKRAEAEPILVIGGGQAGGYAALALRKQGAGPITLIERDPGRLVASQAKSAPFSQAQPDVDARQLEAFGVEVKLDEVCGIDWRDGRLELFSGRRMAFGGLVLAPGIAAREEGIVGLDARSRHLWPAAWGSAREARRLAAQLSAAPDNAQVVLRLPEDAGGHPAVAARRALEIAAFLERHRPSARLTVLDAGEASDAERIFEASAAGLPGKARVTWIGAGQGGRVSTVDSRKGLLETEAGEIRADVVNFVPATRAADLAQRAGLTDATGWCPCAEDGRSLLAPGAVVLGDARKGAVRGLATSRAQGLAVVQALRPV